MFTFLGKLERPKGIKWNGFFHSILSQKSKKKFILIKKYYFDIMENI